MSKFKINISTPYFSDIETEKELYKSKIHDLEKLIIKRAEEIQNLKERHALESTWKKVCAKGIILESPETLKYIIQIASETYKEISQLIDEQIREQDKQALIKMEREDFENQINNNLKKDYETE